MFLKTQNLSEYLVSEGLASFDTQPIRVPKGSPTPKELDTSRYVKAAAIELGNTQLEVEINCIYSPFCFYAQILENKESFYEFEERMQIFYKNEKKKSNVFVLKKPKIGQMCVAKYNMDQSWYRALIKDKNNDLNTVKVFFIDYGNDDTVQIDGNLCVIDEQFVSHPCMGIMCCLDGVKPIPEQSASLGRFKEIVDFMFDSITSRAYATFVAKHGECYTVNLKLESINEAGKKVLLDMSQLLIERNFVLKSDDKKETKPVVKKSRLPVTNYQIDTYYEAKFKAYVGKEPPIDKSKSCSIMVSHVETLNEFYVQLHYERELDNLRPLMNDMQCFYEKKVTNLFKFYFISNFEWF